MNESRDQQISEIHGLLDEVFGRLRPKTPPGGEMNMSLGQMHCLGTIARLGNPTMSEVAELMRLHPSTVTVLVDGLVAHGLARRTADARDRRIVRVNETAKGRRNHERHMAEKRERVGELLSGIEDADLAKVIEGLEILRAAASRHADTL